MSGMDKLFINLWEIDVKSWGNGEREKLYLFQEKGQEKLPKVCVFLRPGYCLNQFCVVGSYCSSLTHVIQIRMNSENHSSFFMCSAVADGHWEPCLSLGSADTRKEKLEGLQPAQRKKLFPPFPLT